MTEQMTAQQRGGRARARQLAQERRDYPSLEVAIAKARLEPYREVGLEYELPDDEGLLFFDMYVQPPFGEPYLIDFQKNPGSWSAESMDRKIAIAAEVGMVLLILRPSDVDKPPLFDMKIRNTEREVYQRWINTTTG